MYTLAHLLEFVLTTWALCSATQSGLSLSPDRAKIACEVAPTIVFEAKRKNLSPSLVASLVWVESRFSPTARSRANACGLTQVIPKWSLDRNTGRRWTCEELYDPHESIRVGTRLLRRMIDRYGRGNLRVGLCYYNAGNACIRDRSWARDMSYVRKVLQIQRRIRRANSTSQKI